MANRPWHYDLPWNSVRSGYRWMRRTFFTVSKPDGVDWWQYHVRAFERDDGLVEFTGHVEPEPTEHAKPHLRGTGYDTSEAMDEFGRTLDAVPAIDVVEDPR